MPANLVFYADAESADALASAQRKAILVGGDFGYGNFGDVLQHMGAASRIRECSSLAVASVFSVHAISRHVDVATLRRSYGVDALMFATEAPLEAEKAARLGLRQVSTIRNVSCVQLYGGGFLNRMWGDSVLEIAEYLLERLPGALYLVSGQQVSPDYVERVAKHVARFRPYLVGIRDRDSLATLTAAGVDTDFSFDDAVEPLLSLSRSIGVVRGSGAFIHLNSSGYTGNDGALHEIARHMMLVADRVGSEGKPVLLQAFQDAREEVVDSLETVKRLEIGFPFAGLETILLVGAAMGVGGEHVRPVTGHFGYSCSYHVALWLQLCGIPCWLRGTNDYYEHKCRALGIEGDFESFLVSMPMPNHGANLEARSRWTRKLDAAIEGADPVTNRVDLEPYEPGVAKHSFHFKGEPRLGERLDQTWAALCGVREENQSLSAGMELLKQELVGTENQLRAMLEERETVQARLSECYTDKEAALGRLQEMSVAHAALHARLEEVSASNQSLLSRLLEAVGQAVELRAEIRRGEDAVLEGAQRLNEALAASKSLEERLYAAGRLESRLLERINALTNQLTILGSESRSLTSKLRDAESGWVAACRGNEELNARLTDLGSERDALAQRLVTVESRLLAYNVQIAEIGSEARTYREQAEWSHARLLETSERERRATELLGLMRGSRSWRWSRPMRVTTRFLKTGRFDMEGQVGVFELTRIVGRKVPMPAHWRSGLGRWLEKMRRK